MNSKGSTYWYFPEPSSDSPMACMGTSTSSAPQQAWMKWFLTKMATTVANPTRDSRPPITKRLILTRSVRP